jgi:8-oxo-dGTP pyrophosphatase MutT (NUDIX family)
MTESKTAPVVPVPAATLMLLRDSSAGIEVLMMLRHDDSGFAGGAMVFPGGKVQAEDHAGAATQPSGDTLPAALRVAAIRESFEECRVLLAHRPGETALVSHAALEAALRAEPQAANFATLLARTGLLLATELLVPFAHWVTPADSRKRFDTHFYLAPAPADQVAQHDGREAIEVRWITPAAATAAADRGELKIVFPTRLNLVKLGRSRTVAEALAAARMARIVTVEPNIVQTSNGPMIQIPADADYGLTEMPVSRIRRA